LEDTDVTSATQPAYRAYTVVKREGQDDYWLAIGAAFKHGDGDGYNLVLQALPIDGRVILRVPKDDDPPADPPRRERQRDDRRGRRPS
jgi:hypothetical protein